MYLSGLQKKMIRQIDDAQLRSITDLVKLPDPDCPTMPIVEHQEVTLGQNNVVQVMPYDAYTRTEVRSFVRDFVTLWYLLEKYDLIRSVQTGGSPNVQALYMKNEAGTYEPNQELLLECSDYLDKLIVPLELHDFIESNKNEDDWLTREQSNTREALRAAKQANVLAWAGILISLVVGIASILIPVLKN